MSLLLFLKPNVVSGWISVTNPSTGWVTSNWDYKNVWSEWGATTWGTIQSSGLTWGNMAGYMFSVTSAAPITTWTVVT